MSYVIRIYARELFVVGMHVEGRVQAYILYTSRSSSHVCFSHLEMDVTCARRDPAGILRRQSRVFFCEVGGREKATLVLTRFRGIRAIFPDR